MKSQEAVITEVAERAPELLAYLRPERDWLWYVGPSLQGDARLRKIIGSVKDGGIGFRWSKNGHTLPSGEVGSWGHSCLKPIPHRRKGRPKRLVQQELITADEM